MPALVTASPAVETGTGTNRLENLSVQNTIIVGGQARTNWPDVESATNFVKKVGDTIAGNLQVTGTVTAAGFSGAGSIPTGAVLPYAGTSTPSGWFLCDGSAVSRTTYAALFAAIGTTYGSGNGSTTFNLPDLRGRIPLGRDNMGGSSADRVTATEADQLGGASGEEKHTLTISEMPSHTHTNNAQSAIGALAQNGANWQLYQSLPEATSATGGDQPHNNMPPYLTLNYIIKQ